MFICDRGTGAQQTRGLVMSEIHRRRPRRCNFEFSFSGNDRRPSQKPGTRQENRNPSDSPDLSPSIPDDRGYLRFRVSLVGKIWDNRETVKWPIVWDFPDVWAFDDFKKWQDRAYFARIPRAFQLTCWMTFIFARNWLVITISWKNYNRLESLLVKYTCVQMLN